MADSDATALERMCPAFGAEGSDVVRRSEDERFFQDESLEQAIAVVVVNDAPQEVLLVALPEGVAVAPLGIRWFGPSFPAPQLRRPVGLIPWPEADAESVPAIARLRALVKKAAVRRRRMYKSCLECGQPTPPEHFHDGRICMGCASEHHGVVY